MICNIFITYYILDFLLYSVHGESSSYGNYDINPELIKHCEKGSKPQLNTYFNLGFKVNKEGHHVITYNFTVIKDTGSLKGRIRVFKWNDGRFEQSLNYNQEDVCKFFFPMNLVRTQLKIDSKCSLMKANYVGEHDMDVLMFSFLGKQFFYGKYKFRFEWFTKKQMVLCADAILSLIPGKKV